MPAPRFHLSSPDFGFFFRLPPFFFDERFVGDRSGVSRGLRMVPPVASPITGGETGGCVTGGCATTGGTPGG